MLLLISVFQDDSVETAIPFLSSHIFLTFFYKKVFIFYAKISLKCFHDIMSLMLWCCQYCCDVVTAVPVTCQQKTINHRGGQGMPKTWRLSFAGQLEDTYRCFYQHISEFAVTIDSDSFVSYNIKQILTRRGIMAAKLSSSSSSSLLLSSILQLDLSSQNTHIVRHGN